MENGRKPVTDSVVDAYRAVLQDPALGLSEVDLARLQATVSDPDGAGASGLADVSAILDRTRHLEDVMGPEAVTPVVRGLDGVARALAARGIGGRQSGVVASEVARYRGWLEHATGRPHLADRCLGDAARLADEVGDGSQLEHALSFRAYCARHRGDLPRAVQLTEAAVEVGDAHPILGVYDRYQRAELLALQGDRRRAARALHDADRVAEARDGIELPAFGYWYTEGFWGLERGLVLAALGRQTAAVIAAGEGVDALPTDHRGTGWVAGMLAQIDPDMTAGA